MRDAAMGTRKEATNRCVMAVLVMTIVVCAAASDGRIPPGTAPYTISAPGSYYLTADLTYSAAAPAITIAANNVSLDLLGHSIWQQSASYFAYGVYASGYTNIKVFDGMINGGGSAVYLANVPAGLVRVDGLTITGAAYYGIYVSGASSQPGVRLTNNSISFNAGSPTNPGGISVGPVFGGEISGNTLIGSGTSAGTGINLNPGAALLIANNAASFFSTGMYISGNSDKVVKNNVSQNGLGIWAANANGIEVQENLMAYNATGLLFSSVTNCVYRENTAQGNGTNYNIPGSGVTNGGKND